MLQCQEGDGDALEALIARWQPRLARLAWRLTGEREAARDAVQDSWLAIVRGLKRLDDPARFRWWAYRIVTNKCADWIRRRSIRRGAAKELRDVAASKRDDSLNQTDSADDAARMLDAMAKLLDEQRAVLSLHYLDEMGVREIAGVLDVPEGTVKSRLHHARNRLKEALERVTT